MNEPHIDPARFEDLVRRVNGIPERVGVLEAKLANLDADLAEIKGTMNAMVRRLEHRDREQAAERKSDRRWLIGTAIAVFGLLLSAGALLVGQL